MSIMGEFLSFVGSLIVVCFTFVSSLIVAYFTAIYAVRREKAHGRARLLDICHRYALNFFNAHDMEAGGLKSDPLAYQIYVKELGGIVDDLETLLSNAYVERLFLKYPRVSKLLVLLRRELIEHSSDATETLQGINQGCLREIFDLRRVIRKDLHRSAPKTEFGQEIDELENALWKQGIIPPNKQMQLTLKTRG